MKHSFLTAIVPWAFLFMCGVSFGEWRAAHRYGTSIAFLGLSIAGQALFVWLSERTDKHGRTP